MKWSGVGTAAEKYWWACSSGTPAGSAVMTSRAESSNDRTHGYPVSASPQMGGCELRHQRPADGILGTDRDTHQQPHDQQHLERADEELQHRPEHEQRLMATTVLAWYAGFMIGYTVSYILELQHTPWRVIMGSSTIIAVVLLIARIGLPESPRWLWTKRRFDEAHAIAHKYMVDAADMTDVEHEDTSTGRHRDAVLPAVLADHAVRLVVLVLRRAPYFAIATFAESVLKKLRPQWWARRWCRTVVVAVAGLCITCAVDRQGRPPGVHRPAAVDHHRSLLDHRPVVGCAARRRAGSVPGSSRS